MRRALPFLLLVACGTAPRPAPSPVPAAALDAWATEGTPAATSTTVARARPTEPVSLRPAPRRLAVRGGGRPLDLDLANAPLESALRLLADAADLGIVVDEGLGQPISVRLRRVRPLDAMRILAETHGVELSRIGDTIVARRAGAR